MFHQPSFSCPGTKRWRRQNCTLPEEIKYLETAIGLDTTSFSAEEKERNTPPPLCPQKKARLGIMETAWTKVMWGGDCSQIEGESRMDQTHWIGLVEAKL